MLDEFTGMDIKEIELRAVFWGIDIGSVTTKAVITDVQDKLLVFSMTPTCYDRHQSGAAILDKALNQIQKSRHALKYIIATGYGRRSFQSADKVLPEIVCHSKGTR